MCESVIVLIVNWIVYLFLEWLKTAFFVDILRMNVIELYTAIWTIVSGNTS